MAKQSRAAAAALRSVDCFVALLLAMTSCLANILSEDGRPDEPRFDRRRMPKRLQHDAIPLGELHERVEMVLRRVRIELEFQPDGGEADRRILGNAERAAKVDVSLRRYFARSQRNP